ncbi:MAG TPA: chemotaxis protein CheR [Cyanobacteria bacterium UBA11369]|nr:chemotaxis protein CheR [Cyanobacteria bacterium UBA11371]HBE48816.1 chemotaxis protein CheR [Cyanobacteria bacterium UBA11369]
MSINAADFDYIRKLVRDRTGVVLSDDKHYLIESRLSILVKNAGVNSIGALVAQLRQKPFNPLYNLIVEALMTNETFFFRDEHPFQALKIHILPELLKQRQIERNLNIWCAACSSGQEPYSIAMLMREHFPNLSNWKAQIIASDISNAMLEKARVGRYGQHEIIRGLPTKFMQKYFQPCGNDWQLKEEIRQIVEFRQINLTSTFPLLSPMDIIFLRNVLIYFDIETKRAILSRVRQLLKPDGYLFLGGGETTINLDDAFEPVQFGKAVCYKLRSHRMVVS